MSSIQTLILSLGAIAGAVLVIWTLGDRIIQKIKGKNIWPIKLVTTGARMALVETTSSGSKVFTIKKNLTTTTYETGFPVGHLMMHEPHHTLIRRVPVSLFSDRVGNPLVTFGAFTDSGFTVSYLRPGVTLKVEAFPKE